MLVIKITTIIILINVQFILIVNTKYKLEKSEYVETCERIHLRLVYYVSILVYYVLHDCITTIPKPIVTYVITFSYMNILNCYII